MIGEKATWLLRWKARGEGWVTCDGYTSAEAAMVAVAQGQSGISEWDVGKIDPEKFTVDLWFHNLSETSAT